MLKNTIDYGGRTASEGIFDWDQFLQAAVGVCFQFVGGDKLVGVLRDSFLFMRERQSAGIFQEKDV